MSDELLDMQRYTWNRLLLATGAISLLGLSWLMYVAPMPFGLEYIIWIGTIPLNVIMHVMARTRFREATWMWTCTLTALLTFSIPWKSIPNVGPLPYGLMLIIVMSSVLISRRAPLIITGLASVLYPVAVIVTGHSLLGAGGAFLPPVVMAWATAILSWISSDQLVTALEWTSKARLVASSQAESLRQNRDALQKSVQIRDNLNAQLQSANEQVTRRAMQFEAMAEVSRHITSLLDFDKLLAEVVNLICARFDYYGASIFMMDEKEQVLVLRAAGGAQGPALLQRNLRLPPDDSNLNGHAISTGQMQNVGNVPMSPHPKREDLLPGTLSELAIPLQLGERIVGTLHAQSVQYNAFGKDDVTVLQGLADQVAVAIQNTRSFQQAQLALQELEMTNRLLTSQGWQEYLQRQSATRQVELGVAGASAVTAEVPSEPLSISLELRGRSIGKLSVHRESGNPWSDEEVEMIRAIALQTALAADNARLVEQTQLTLQETEGLFEATRTIAGLTQLTEICQSLANYANTLEQADRTIVTLADTQRRQILAHVGTGHLEGELDLTFDEFEASIAGKVLRSGEPVLSVSADNGLEPEQRERHPDSVDSNIGSLIVAPLTIKGQVVGVISVANRTDQRQFAQHDVELIMALAGPAATAIENVRLLEATQRRAERERLIRQITTRIRAANDLESVLQTTAAELAQSLRVPRAIVRLTMGDGANEA